MGGVLPHGKTVPVWKKIYPLQIPGEQNPYNRTLFLQRRVVRVELLTRGETLHVWPELQHLRSLPGTGEKHAQVPVSHWQYYRSHFSTTVRQFSYDTNFKLCFLARRNREQWKEPQQNGLKMAKNKLFFRTLWNPASRTKLSPLPLVENFKTSSEGGVSGTSSPYTTKLQNWSSPFAVRTNGRSKSTK